MRIFNILDDGKIVLDAHVKEFKVFKELSKRLLKCEGDHDGRKKLMNLKELTFIYHVGYFDSRYTLEDDEGIHSLKIRLDLDSNWEPDVLVEEGIKLYEDLQKTKSWKTYKVLEDLEKSARLYLEKQNTLLGEGTMEPKDAKIVLGLTAEITNIVSHKEALKKTLMKEQDGVTRTGTKNRTLNKFELNAPSSRLSS